MSVRFDHVAVAARDKQRSALFLCNLLGLPEPDDPSGHHFELITKPHGSAA
jgi:catechol 2,3-dioxygenase-like lactoylglutathione lyase family enzyme